MISILHKINPILKAHLAMSAVAILYGANYSIAKIVLDDNYMTPFGFIFLRIIVAGAVLFVAQSIFIKEKIQRKDWPRLVICGIFGAGINMLLFFLGLANTNPINASLVMTTAPILVLITSAIVLGERITILKVVGILLGAAGVITLLIYGKNFSYSSSIGDIYVLLNAMSYGIYLVLVKKLMATYHPLTVIKWVMFFGLIFVSPFGAEEFFATRFSSFTPTIWWSVLYVVIGATIFTYTLNATALATVNPSIVSIYIYVQPLIASVIALWLGQDSITLAKLTAGGFIFVGVYLVSMQNKKLNKT